MDSVLFNPTFKNLVKPGSVCTDNTVFRLHYRITAPLLLVGGVLLSAAQFFGKPISCFLPSVLIFPVNVVETYCWAEGTFTLPKTLNKTVGKEVPYPGVDKKEPGDEVIYHAYYQWVCFVLLLQALLFIVPHIIWAGLENSDLSNNLMSLNKPIVDKVKRIASYKYLCLRFFSKSDVHDQHFKKMLLCLASCFANVVGQIYLIDTFLGGEFTTYGSDVFKFMKEDPEVRTDPMVRVFPRMAKCTFRHYGPSGDVQKIDTVCILPLNILNEKLYAILWFWFVILAVLTGIDLGLKLLALVSPVVRFGLTRLNNFWVRGDYLQAVVYELNSEQWFLLHLLGANLNKLHFKELVEQIFTHMNWEVATEEYMEPLTPHWQVLENEEEKTKMLEEDKKGDE